MSALSPQEAFDLFKSWGFSPVRVTGSHMIMQCSWNNRKVTTADPRGPASKNVSHDILRRGAQAVGVTMAEFQRGPEKKKEQRRVSSVLTEELRSAIQRHNIRVGHGRDPDVEIDARIMELKEAVAEWAVSNAAGNNGDSGGEIDVEIDGGETTTKETDTMTSPAPQPAPDSNEPEHATPPTQWRDPTAMMSVPPAERAQRHRENVQKVVTTFLIEPYTAVGWSDVEKLTGLSSGTLARLVKKEVDRDNLIKIETRTGNKGAWKRVSYRPTVGFYLLYAGDATMTEDIREQCAKAVANVPMKAKATPPAARTEARMATEAETKQIEAKFGKTIDELVAEAERGYDPQQFVARPSVSVVINRDELQAESLQRSTLGASSPPRASSGSPLIILSRRPSGKLLCEDVDGHLWSCTRVDVD